MQSLPWDLSVSVYGRKQSETESVRVSHEAHLETEAVFQNKFVKPSHTSTKVILSERVSCNFTNDTEQGLDLKKRFNLFALI